jgi:hypothetical protein
MLLALTSSHKDVIAKKIWNDIFYTMYLLFSSGVSVKIGLEK